MSRTTLLLASGIALLLVLGVTGGGALVSAKPGTADNTYQAPPSQERGDPPGRAAEQGGRREVSGSSRL